MFTVQSVAVVATLDRLKTTRPCVWRAQKPLDFWAFHK